MFAGFFAVLIKVFKKYEIIKYSTTSMRIVFSVCLLACFALRPKSTAMVIAVSSPNHTFFLRKLEQAVNQYFVHIRGGFNM